MKTSFIHPNDEMIKRCLHKFNIIYYKPSHINSQNAQQKFKVNDEGIILDGVLDESKQKLDKEFIQNNDNNDDQNSQVQYTENIQFLDDEKIVSEDMSIQNEIQENDELVPENDKTLGSCSGATYDEPNTYPDNEKTLPRDIVTFALDTQGFLSEETNSELPQNKSLYRNNSVIKVITHSNNNDYQYDGTLYPKQDLGILNCKGACVGEIVECRVI